MVSHIHPAASSDRLIDSASTPLIRARRRLGATELLVLSDGTCRFDGGAMFGVVPKTLWSRVAAPDAENRVELGLNTLVVRSLHDGRLLTVVIETGFGEKLPAKFAAIYGAQARLLDAFAEAGIAPGEVDVVINTHLHWDHCGWNTRLGPHGAVLPTFPNARYYAHAGEIAHGRARSPRDAISYVPENYEPLLATGQMVAVDLVEGEERELAPGIAVELFPGHTRQLMAVHVRDAASGRRACYISDLVPTVAHLPLTWGMAFDLDPERNIHEKQRFYTRAVREGWLIVFAHEAGCPVGYLEAAPNGARLCLNPPG